MRQITVYKSRLTPTDGPRDALRHTLTSSCCAQSWTCSPEIIHFRPKGPGNSYKYYITNPVSTLNVHESPKYSLPLWNRGTVTGRSRHIWDRKLTGGFVTGKPGQLRWVRVRLQWAGRRRGWRWLVDRQRSRHEYWAPSHMSLRPSVPGTRPNLVAPVYIPDN